MAGSQQTSSSARRCTPGTRLPRAVPCLLRLRRALHVRRQVGLQGRPCSAAGGLVAGSRLSFRTLFLLCPHGPRSLLNCAALCLGPSCACLRWRLQPPNALFSPHIRRSSCGHGWDKRGSRVGPSSQAEHALGLLVQAPACMDQAALKRLIYSKQRGVHPLSAELCACAQCSRTGNVGNRANARGMSCGLTHCPLCGPGSETLSSVTPSLQPACLCWRWHDPAVAWWCPARVQVERSMVGGGKRPESGRGLQAQSAAGTTCGSQPRSRTQTCQSRLSINHPLTFDLHCTQSILLIPAQAAHCVGLERFGWAVRSRDRRRLSGGGHAMHWRLCGLGVGYSRLGAAQLGGTDSGAAAGAASEAFLAILPAPATVQMQGPDPTL